MVSGIGRHVKDLFNAIFVSLQHKAFLVIDCVELGAFDLVLNELVSHVPAELLG